MFKESALLGIIIGFFRGGKLGRLLRIDLQGWPLAAIALLIQAGLWASFRAGWNLPDEFTPYIHLLSYLPMLIFVYINRKQPGMYLIALGLLLNLLVIAANGGAMPVDPVKLAPLSREKLLSGTASPLHTPIVSTTRLAFLGDIIRVPCGDHRMISWGDIGLSLGLLYFIQQGMQEKEASGKRRPHH